MTKDQIQIIEEAKKIRAMCNHRSEDNTFDTLQYDRDTKIARCTQCGCTFTPMDTTYNPEDDIKKVIDCIQTIKILWPDMPEESAEKIYSILPILEDLSTTYSIAVKHCVVEGKKNLNNFSNTLKNLNAAFNLPKCNLADSLFSALEDIESSHTAK